MPLVRTFSLVSLALAATFLATPGVLLAGAWDTYAQAPLSLEPNQGQTDPGVDFIARGRGYSVFLTATGLVLSLQTKSTAAPPTVLRVELAGARASHAEGLDEQAGKSHYFLGNDPAKWRTNIPHFARVKYPGVYPGIDLVWYGNHGRLEYDFQLAPGADPRRIEFVFEGSDKIRIEPGGDLVVRVADHEFHHLRPVVYQQTELGRRFVSGRYVRRAERAVGFEVSGYDPRKPIVIDPVLAFSTFLGGDGQDSGHAVALDAGGNVYVTSATTSLDFPTRNPYQGANAGASDVSITKLDPTGTIMLYSTYLGGSGTENDFRAGVNASGIAVDAAGNVYVTGRTASPDFPVVNALQASFRGGDYDAFVAKLSPDGGALLYSTYLGGAASDSGNGIASDPAGNVYVVGGTRSDDYPITAGAFQQFPGGQLDAYVTKIDPTQSGAASLVYSTYLGGLGIDRGASVVVDSEGNAYVTGRTESPDFPTQNPFQPVYGGGADAFVAKLNASGTALAYSTFLGGSGLDVGNGIALDSAGNVYVTGETASGTFPTQNAFQANNGGSSDAFVVGLNASGSALVYGTYLGGGGNDRGNSLAVDPAGKIYVVGDTTSVNFPLLSALQGQNAGGKDAFVAALDPGQAGAASLVYSSYLGGAGDDAGLGITVDSSGEAWITGETSSANWPTVNPLQPVFGGGRSDAFVARIARGSGSPEFVVSGDPSSRTIMPEGTATYTVAVTPSGGFRGSIDLSISGLPANSSAVFSPTTVLIVDASPQSSTLTVSTESSVSLGTFPLTVTGTGATVQHTATVSLVISNSGNTADLALTKTVSSNPVALGTNLTYTLNVLNRGPAVATGITVTDVLPAVVLVSATPSQGTCSGTTTITCNLGPLAAGGGAAITLVVTPQAVGLISNNATVSGNAPDPDLRNNSAAATTVVEPQGTGPRMLDPNLSVRTVVSGLTQPTGIAFLGPNDFLVLEKSTGQVKRVVNGAGQGVALDLAVNSASERGLLGIALHPDFANNGFVYLYWTCRGPAAGADCDSMFGDDTADISQVPLLGNRVDRFIWDGSTLTFDRNLIRLHSYQADADQRGVFNQPLRGNHNGGKLAFGPDGNLYVLIGDNGRRGWLQNIVAGVLPNGQDDQFGGPQPDNVHLTGVIVRLGDDGRTPPDNPFFDVGAQMGGELGANIQKIYAYGVRNSFGMAFDPLTGNLWTEENGDDSFDEINLVGPGFNGGWVQIMGPSRRITDFKGIETSPANWGLQQERWPPTLIADTPDGALAALFLLAGARYTEPLFSWKHAVAPSPIGFVSGRGLGPRYQGDLFVGASRTFLAGGYLFRFKLSADRSDLVFGDTRLRDRVADNADKFDLTESESLYVGGGFGITTDIQSAPNGNLYVVSLSDGAIYEIFAPAMQESSTHKPPRHGERKRRQVRNDHERDEIDEEERREARHHPR